MGAPTVEKRRSGVVWPERLTAGHRRRRSALPAGRSHPPGQLRTDPRNEGTYCGSARLRARQRSSTVSRALSSQPELRLCWLGGCSKGFVLLVSALLLSAVPPPVRVHCDVGSSREWARVEVGVKKLPGWGYSRTHRSQPTTRHLITGGLR